jgi:hypothetical protein
MAKQNDETATLAAILETLTDNLAALRSSQPRREINFGDQDYQEQLRAERQTLKKPAFQNGFEVNPSGLSDETIDRLANLTPGVYAGGLIRVATDNDAIHLIYKNKTVEQRMAFGQRFPSFTAMVNAIWDEQQRSAAA